VELVVVIAIIAVMAGIALVGRGNTNAQLQRQTASRQLKEVFERARFDSVKRRADGTEPFAQVEVHSDRFILTTYTKEANGTATAKVQETHVPAGVIIEHYSSGSLPMPITFNRRGETAGGVPQFRICNVTCTNPTNSTSDILAITPTGTVNLLPGGSSFPSFPTPGLNGAPSDSELINDMVVMP